MLKLNLMCFKEVLYSVMVKLNLDNYLSIVDSALTKDVASKQKSLQKVVNDAFQDLLDDLASL